MKAGGGKTKGSAYEREVGNQISLWLSHGTRKDLLCRTVGSGAQFTSAARRGSLAGKPGDLMAQDPLAFRFCDAYVIEIKHWRDLELIRFYDKQGELYDAMLKVTKEAKDGNKSWWLVCKQNNRAALLLMPIGVHLLYTRNVTYYHSLFNGEVALFKFDDFLKNVIPEQFLNAPILEGGLIADGN